MIELNETDKRILEEIQKDFPLVSNPFKEIGIKCNITEQETIDKIQKFSSENIIREISAILNASMIGYKSILVAVKANNDSINKVAEKINQHPGVSHNYLRENKYNIWFTLTIKQEFSFHNEVKNILGSKGVSGYLILPSINTFKIGVNFRFSEDKVDQQKPVNSFTNKQVELKSDQKLIINKLQENFNIVSNPYKSICEYLNISEFRLFEQIKELKKAGMIKRISAVLRHRNIGFDFNGMTCLKIPDDKIKSAGEKTALFPEVSHCYQRPTFPDWPYSLFAMIHSRTKKECFDIVNKISKKIECSDYIVLFSTKEFKKERVKYNLTQ